MAVTTQTLLRLCAAMGMTQVWVRKTALQPLSATVRSRAIGYVVSMCSRELGVGERDGGAHDARARKALLNKGRRQLTEWALVVPVAQ